ncbi:MAG: N-acetylmuramoyl-L-alanine amidase [Bacteroidales bacterium]|nr:N-acetylmuramoyl-L-alanine amidase [Bacteroidales bacterium]
MNFLYIKLVIINLILINKLFCQIIDKKVDVIVIDPGHGGKDPGATYNGIKEKDITLSVALKLGELIEKNLPDVKVIYTRRTDEFVELHKRAKIANENKADLFLCIHVNASKKSEIYGTETYIMGLSKSSSNLEVAIAENAVILKEDNYKEEYDGFDPYSPEAYIIFTLYQSANMDLSISVASFIQEEYKKLNFEERGVKQAGFLVLWKTTMPAVLTEIGFITNESERNYLKDEKNHYKYARCLYNAIVRYKNYIENANYKLLAENEDYIEKDSIINCKLEANIINKSKSLKKEDSKKEDSKIENKTLNDSLIYKDYTAKKAICNMDTIYKEDKFQKSLEKLVSAIYNDTVYFLIQIMSSVKRVPKEKFQENIKVEEFYFDNAYKYMCCRTRSYNEALNRISEIRKQYEDAFIVSIKNGIKIPIKEALRIVNERK